MCDSSQRNIQTGRDFALNDAMTVRETAQSVVERRLEEVNDRHAFLRWLQDAMRALPPLPAVERQLHDIVSRKHPY